MPLTEFFDKLEADKYIATMYGKDIKKARADLEKVTGPTVDMPGIVSLLKSAQTSIEQANTEINFALKDLKGGTGKPGTPKSPPTSKRAAPTPHGNPSPVIERP